MAKFITKIVQALKITNPSRSEKAGYFLMHDAETKEVCAVPEAAILAKVNNRIDGIIYPDGFTKTTPIARVGNTISIAAYDFAWRIVLNPYTNADAFSQTFDPVSSPELKRIDSLAVTTEGTIVYHQGIEDEFIFRAPDIPSDQLWLTDVTIFGDDVQEHTEPIVTEVFTLSEKEKLAVLDPTADIDKPVSTAQAAADADTLAAANAYADTKVDGDDKTSSVAGQEASNSYFPSNNGFTSWIRNTMPSWLAAKATALVDGDFILIGDSEDSSKTKTRTFAQLLVTLGTRLATYFQTKDAKFYIGSSGNVQDAWSGGTVYFTANCTITVPSTLGASFEEFGFRTMPGVTVTWAITAPFTWETTPSTTPEKTDGLFTRYNGGNTIIIRW